MLPRPWRLAVMLTGALAVALPAFAQKVVLPDRVYGEGGSREIEVVNHNDGSKTTYVTVRDKGGNIREHHKRHESGKDAAETHDWFDASGHKVRSAWIDYDGLGQTTYFREENFDDKGSMNAGNIDQKDDKGQWIHLRWDNNLNKWMPKDAPKNPPFKPIRLPFNWFGAQDLDVTSNNFYIGAGFVFEDSFHRFLTKGFEASYTHALPSGAGTPSRFGIVGDFEWTHGTSGEVTYSKVQGLGGLAIAGGTSGKMFWGLHALAGFARVHSHSSVNPEIPSDTGTSFAIAAGVDAGTQVNEKIDVQIRVDFNPAIRRGYVSKNFRLSGGVRYRF